MHYFACSAKLCLAAWDAISQGKCKGRRTYYRDLVFRLQLLHFESVICAVHIDVDPVSSRQGTPLGNCSHEYVLHHLCGRLLEVSRLRLQSHECACIRQV